MGAFAAAFVVLYIAALGVLVFIALLRDPMLRWQLARRSARRTDKHTVIGTASLRVSSESPIWSARKTAALASNDLAMDGLTLEATPPEDDPVLSPFLSEYLYAAWYFKHLDLGVLFVLATLQVRTKGW